VDISAHLQPNLALGDRNRPDFCRLGPCRGAKRLPRPNSVLPMTDVHT